MIQWLPTVRRCRECGQLVRVGDDYRLGAHREREGWCIGSDTLPVPTLPTPAAELRPTLWERDPESDTDLSIDDLI